MAKPNKCMLAPAMPGRAPLCSSSRPTAFANFGRTEVGVGGQVHQRVLGAPQALGQDEMDALLDRQAEPGRAPHIGPPSLCRQPWFDSRERPRRDSAKG